MKSDWTDCRIENENGREFERPLDDSLPRLSLIFEHTKQSGDSKPESESESNSRKRKLSHFLASNEPIDWQANERSDSSELAARSDPIHIVNCARPDLK